MAFTYTNYEIDLRSIPGEICLTFYICDCPCHCLGCSSPWLWQKGDYELTTRTIDKAIEKYPYATCVLFMGGDHDYDTLKNLATHVRLKERQVAFYSGRGFNGNLVDYLDYYKTGPWLKDYGPLNSPTTNQRLYLINHKAFLNRGEHHIINITPKFWTRENAWKEQQEKDIELTRNNWYNNITKGETNED